MNDKSEYLKSVLEQIPRLLGLMNRNPLSPSYGCFDRNYWHYKSVDMACARSQEAVLTLALLYLIKSKDNKYYDNTLVLEWINAGIGFWTEIQEMNGSFNEWYPKENSFVTTAFTSYAVSETLLLLKDKIKNSDFVVSCLKNSADWLISKGQPGVRNQECGAILAIYNTYLLTKNERYKKAAFEKVNAILKAQTYEGWFYEYGGADIGYLSLTVDYLSKLYKKTKDKKILQAVKKSVDFLSYFCHPNLTFGGEYGSRNTEYFIPSGFEILAKEDKNAAGICRVVRESLKARSSIAPFSFDDKYLTYVMYTWLQAYLNAGELNNPVPRFNRAFSKNFPSARILVQSSQDSYLIVNYGKGGSFKLFIGGNNFYDSGLLVEMGTKKLTSGDINPENSFNIDKSKITVEGYMTNIKDKTLKPISNVLLRIFQMTIGRNYFIGKAVKNKLRTLLITKKKQSRVKFKREIDFTDSVKITDSIEGEKISRVIIGSKHSYIYTPSSRYFQESELSNKPLFLEANGKGKIKVIRTFEKTGNQKVEVRK